MVTEMNLKQMFLGKVLGETTTNVYTVSSSVQSAVVKELVIFNNGTTSANVEVAINGINLVSQDIDPKDSLFGDKTWYLVMNANDTLTITTDKEVNVLLSGVETVAASV